MNNKKLAFILPIYNVEAYLEECIESILKQATKDIEIILVDDGATDTSGQICDNYAQKYDFIKVVHKENGGLSSARNAGLKVVTAEYVSFIDSDDRIADGSLKEIINYINDGGCDLCFMQAIKFYPDGTSEDLGDGINGLAINGKTLTEQMNYLSSRPKFPGSSCTKIYKREFIVRNDLHFPYDRRYSEDLGFVINSMYLAQSIHCLDFPFYEYRQNRVGSITNTFKIKNFNDLSLFVIEGAEQFCNDKKAIDDKAKCLMSFIAYEYSILLWQLNKLSGEDKKSAYKFLKQYIWVLKFANSKKTKIIKIFANLLGIRLTSKLLKIAR